MLYDVPKLRDDLHLSPTQDSETGRLNYRLSCPTLPGSIQLDIAPLMLVMMFDGQLNIQSACKRAGMLLGMEPPPEMVEQLAAALYQAGFAERVALNSLPQQTLPGTEHVCEGCGRSCEGHLIGPLPTSEVKTIAEIFDALAEKVPRLQGRGPVFRHKEHNAYFLTLDNGRCLFLDDDRKCAIHRHFGPEFKPSICRTFPYSRIYTEHGLRVGINSSCYHHHNHVARAFRPPSGPIVLEGELASLPPVMDDVAPFALAPLQWKTPSLTQGLAAMDQLETRLLEMLGTPNRTIAGLIATLMELPPGPSTARVPVAVVEQSRRVLARLRSDVDLDDTFLGYMLRQSGEGLAAAYRQFMENLDAFVQETTPAVAFDMPAPYAAFLLDNARRMVWNRKMMQFNNPFSAVAVLLLGGVLGLQAAPSDASEDARFSQAVACFTSWHRAIVESGGDEVFADQHEAASFLRAWL